MPFNKFGHPFFYPTKTGGFNYEMSDNPKSDNPLEGLDQDFSVSGNVITMKCNGPTSFSVGKNGRGFTGSIGGCNMDFAATAKRGYGYKKDDVRDLEFKCVMKINNIGGHGFSLSACTGRHTSSTCCQGFAYMGNIDEPASNPPVFRFRKEIWHVNYSNSPEGTFTHPKANFKLEGGPWFGFGFCRYNKPTQGGTSPQDDNVVCEIWFNPNPESNPKDWTMLKRVIDSKGNGWGSGGGKCNGDDDQVGVWSNAHNRLKSNATSGTINFKQISFREIDPSKSFDDTEPPPPPDDGGGEPPPGPPPPGGGGNPPDDPDSTIEVMGAFTLRRDINSSRTSPCEGSSGGGGSGGKSVIYDAPSDIDRALSDTEPWKFRTRLGEKIKKKDSGMYGKVLKQLDVPLKKVGSPAASPTITAVIWNSANKAIYTSPTEIDPTTLTTSFVTQSFDFSANTHTLVIGDIVGIRYYADSATSDVNYIVAGYEEVASEGRSVMFELLNGVGGEKPTKDFGAVMWE